MSIKYLSLTVNIHGIDIKDEAAIDFLVGWTKAGTWAALTGNNKELFNFSNESESDIEVSVFECAGDLDSHMVALLGTDIEDGKGRRA